MTDETFTEDELTHIKGQDAEQFLLSIQSGSQYFLNLLQEMERELFKQMMDLRPWQKDEFSIIKAQLENLYEPLKRVHLDIQFGKQAFARMNGVVDQTQGIL
jgi:hypothetical protein